MLNGFMLKFAHARGRAEWEEEDGGIFSNLKMSKSQVTNLFARSECDKMLYAATGIDPERLRRSRRQVGSEYRQGCNNT